MIAIWTWMGTSHLRSVALNALRKLGFCWIIEHALSKFRGGVLDETTLHDPTIKNKIHPKITFFIIFRPALFLLTISRELKKPKRLLMRFGEVWESLKAISRNFCLILGWIMRICRYFGPVFKIVDSLLET